MNKDRAAARYSRAGGQPRSHAAPAAPAAASVTGHSAARIMARIRARSRRNP
ncbi:MAG TPA: hypothetical protein VKV80_13025 [Streptosporangiaceae bacterium]|nr:hypothetical protein [Streptosporangiaceae bacterium]